MMAHNSQKASQHGKGQNKHTNTTSAGHTNVGSASVPAPRHVIVHTTLRISEAAVANQHMRGGPKQGKADLWQRALDHKSKVRSPGAGRPASSQKLSGEKLLPTFFQPLEVPPFLGTWPHPPSAQCTTPVPALMVTSLTLALSFDDIGPTRIIQGDLNLITSAKSSVLCKVTCTDPGDEDVDFSEQLLLRISACGS